MMNRYNMHKLVIKLSMHKQYNMRKLVGKFSMLKKGNSTHLRSPLEAVPVKADVDVHIFGVRWRRCLKGWR